MHIQLKPPAAVVIQATDAAAMAHSDMAPVTVTAAAPAGIAPDAGT